MSRTEWATKRDGTNIFRRFFFFCEIEVSDWSGIEIDGNHDIRRSETASNEKENKERKKLVYLRSCPSIVVHLIICQSIILSRNINDKCFLFLLQHSYVHMNNEEKTENKKKIKHKTSHAIARSCFSVAHFCDSKSIKHTHSLLPK